MPPIPPKVIPVEPAAAADDKATTSVAAVDASAVLAAQAERVARLEAKVFPEQPAAAPAPAQDDEGWLTREGWL